MKVKKLFGTLVVAVLCSASLWSQEKTITGTVTDADGLPLPGVNIVVENSTNGTQSDFDGNYSISASQGQILVFTYLGQKTARRAIGTQSVINVQMEEDIQALEEVIVTALGIKREKQALGYAVAEVSSEQLEEKAEGDLGRVLMGKASGVNITQQSGLSGSGTNIIIRGFNSFSQSNQPLFIVDGVPFNGDTNPSGRQGSRQDFINGNNGSSRFLDLDPNSIESVNVLKGLAASTLYGSLGRNGVILITTKAGSGGQGAKKTEITVTSSMFFNEIASTPKYQNEYGNGFDQAFGWFFSNWGPAFRREGLAGWGNSASFDADGTLPHPYSTSTSSIQAAFPEYANARYDWKPYKSFENFFKTGTVANTSINVTGASSDGKISYNMNYGYLKDQGFTPGNSLNRNNFGVGGRAVLSNKFTVSGTINYARTKFISPPVALSLGNGATGSGSSVFGDLYFTPRSVDVLGLPYQNPITGGSVYYRQNNSIQHPLWTVNNSGTQQSTNRVFGNMAIQYDLSENLNLSYRVGIDNYSENNLNYQNKGGVNSNSNDIRLQSGIYETWNNTNTIWDHNLSFNGDFDLSETIGSTFNLGFNGRREVFNQNGVSSDGQQVFGVLRHFNFYKQNEIQQTSERNVVGFYGQAEFDYDNFVFITLAGRNDWVSNLTKENRALFYPSASLSFVPTTAFDGLKSDVLNYFKLRAGYGTSAGFPDQNSDSYPVAYRLISDTQDFQDDSGKNIVTNTTPLTLGNANLKPEQVAEIELGIESRWWDGRITLDASIYQRTTTDLIVTQPLDPSSGYYQTTTNVGEIKGEGVEVDLGLNLIRSDSDGFNWNSNINFSATETTVEDLGQDTDQIVYSGYGNLGNAAIEGQPLGVIYGSRVLRDTSGNLVVNSAGDYVQDSQDGVIGDPNPDFMANFNNNFSLKGFNLGFQFNWTQGGDIYSGTIATLLGRGLIEETVDRENTFILPGVQQSDGRVNDVQINNSDYFFNNVLFGPSELQVYDATLLRLQEVSLGYSVPKKFLDRTPLGSLSFTVSGFNLWYDAINTPDGANFDPNTSGTGVGNGFGFDFLNGPSSRRYGFSVKATF